MSEETDPQRPAPEHAGPQQAGPQQAGPGDEELPALDGFETMDPSQVAEMEAAMAEARARLLSVAPETVVVNHVMGLYELAAIHLSNTPPNLAAASLAIDSMALLVDGLGDRLGADAPTMRDALGNIRMAFVAVSSADGTSASASDTADSEVVDGVDRRTPASGDVASTDD